MNSARPFLVARATPALEAAAKPDLLFFGPLPPWPLTRGLALRSYRAARALSRAYRLHHVVLHFGLRPPASCEPVAPFVSTTAVPIEPWKDPLQLLLRAVHLVSPALYARLWPGLASEHRFVTRLGLKRLKLRLQAIPYRRIYVHRLYMLAFALPFLTPGVPLDLDLDDVESSTRERLARLAHSLGRRREGEVLARDSHVYSRLEKQLLPRADRVFVCSDLDRRRLAQAVPEARVVTMPNVVPLPSVSPGTHPRALELLFVGALNYLPNWDACLQLATAVLPALDRRNASYRLTVVGDATVGLPAELAAHPRVRLAGRVERLEPWYAQATAAVVPLRAGGGTRLKILEALAHGCPVVSTGIGAEGLALQPEVHFLQADDGESFAEACLRLQAEPRLRQALARAGRQLVESCHRPELVDDLLLGRS